MFELSKWRNAATGMHLQSAHREYIEWVNEVEAAFTPYYVSSVVRTLLFFLDPLRAGRIRICDILASGFIEALWQLADTSTTKAHSVVRTLFFFLDPLRAGRIRICDIIASGFIEALWQLADASTTKEQLEVNRFSLQRARRVYATFLHLDVDRSGMLSRAELAGFNGDSLTDAFLDGVFQACLTFEGEVDFKGYLDLVLAVENRNEPQSIAYIFRIVDLEGQGRLCVKSVEYLVHSLLQLLADQSDPPTPRDVMDEIFDMVQPQHPGYITLDDLLKSGHGHTVLAILTDANCFMQHENCEL
nr:serine:threonine protein phosphatase 2A [Hymenolepis microstoma]